MESKLHKIVSGNFRFSILRLTILFGISFAFLFLSLSFRVGEKNSNLEPKTENSTISRRAISLKVLLNMISNLKDTDSYPEIIRNFAGITRLNGYIFDQENQDIILFGESDTSQPKILFEDFVMALLNVKKEFAEKKGNTRYYSYPGCSIDPNPQTMARLDKINFKGKQEDIFEDSVYYGEWFSVCESPQKVRVMGVPFKSHFAYIMVFADYDMKTIVDGSDSLPIDGFVSLVERHVNIEKEQIKNGKEDKSFSKCMNRFWFCPGKTIFGHDTDIVAINSCNVQLMTEEEFLTQSNKIKGTGKPNELAKDFVHDFTKRYSEIAKLRPIYYELENLYRFFGIATSLCQKNTPEYAELMLNKICNKARYGLYNMPDTLPGRPMIRWTTYHKTYTQGDMIHESISRLYFPSCGGVNMEIKISSGSYVKGNTGKLAALSQAVTRTSERSFNTLFWNY